MFKAAVPLIVISVFLLVCGGIIFYMNASPRFEVATLGIRGHSRLNPDEIVAHLNIQPHTNIFHIRLDEIRELIESMTWVKQAEVYRNFPNKLSIRLTERTPFALVKADELHLVDQDGVVLGALASGSAIRLPIITGAFVKDIDLEGENPQLKEALHSIGEIRGASPAFLQNMRKIQIDCLENVTVFHDEALPELRLSLKDFRRNLQRLEKIYPELEPEKLATIDLRFDKRVILTPKNS